MRKLIADRVRNIVRNEIRVINKKDTADYYLAATLDQLSHVNMWWIDAVNLRDNYLEIIGWAIMPHDMQRVVSFAVNGELFDKVTYPICNRGLANIYYFKPNSALCGFKCKKQIQSTSSISKDNLLSFNVVSKATLLPIEGFYNIHAEAEEVDQLPVPDDSNLARIGAVDIRHSLSVGFGKFMRLEEALMKYANKTYRDLEKILDWGCGCGQVLRYFHRYSNVEIHGADIDRVNIEWCENNLEFAKFRQVPLIPPTDYEPDYFDLIFGMSVVTHLREKDQSEWLAELSRITKPGGVVLLSIHGNGGVAFRNELFDLENLFRWQEKGFIAIGVDGSIDTIDDEEYYTTSFQTEWYVRREWAKYFEIIDIIPSYIGHFQDLVVLKKAETTGSRTI